MTFTQIKATSFQVQFMSKSGFTSCKHENEKICLPRLVRFSLYSSPVWLKTCSVRVLLRSHFT